jgi:N-acetylglucosamine repressor
MRKINPYDFRLATRSTPRDVNRRILLNLVREHQPISRADLARRTKLGRGAVTKLVNELIGEGVVYEGATGEAARGRKPTSLYVRTHDRLVVAADVRLSRTYLMLGDFSGKQLAFETFETALDPAVFVKNLAARIGKMLKSNGAEAACEGVGVVVPGMVERRTGRVINAPTLGWRDVDLLRPLAARTKLPVHVENAPKACALAKLWLGRGEAAGRDDFVYVSVSDGVGVGVVVGGELLRGDDNIAGEFGHVPLSLDGPRCACGANGCWEAYVSNIATLTRYFGPNLPPAETKGGEPHAIHGLIARARAGDAQAAVALQTTARYLGLGLSVIVNALNPARVFVGGEITAAWDLLEETVRAALAERALTPAAARTPIAVEPAIQYPRLLGAAALVAAPAYAAPRVA